MIFYVCQKDSRKDEETGRLLQTALNRRVWLLYWDASLSFRKNADAMAHDAWKASDGSDVIAGEGIGGFYAVEVAKDVMTCAVAFSPAMHPKAFLQEQDEAVRSTYPECLSVPEWLPLAGFARKDDPDADLIRASFPDFRELGDGHWTEQAECLDAVRGYENIAGISPEA